MRAEGKNRTFAGQAAGTAADDVADRIDHDVGQTVFTHEPGDFPGSYFFLEGGRRDFGNADLFGLGKLGFVKRLLHGALNGGHGEDAFDLGANRFGKRRNSGGHE